MGEQELSSDGCRGCEEWYDRLEEPFRLMRAHPGHLLYLDIKDVRLPQLADLVRAFDVTGQVILAAPDEQLLRSWRQLLPQGQTLLWMGMGGEGGEATLRLARLREEASAGITQLQLHVEVIQRDDTWELAPSLDLFRQTADELAAFNVVFQALPWECSDPEVCRALEAAGVQSFASDYSEVVLRVLRDTPGDGL